METIPYLKFLLDQGYSASASGPGQGLKEPNLAIQASVVCYSRIATSWSRSLLVNCICQLKFPLGTGLFFALYSELVSGIPLVD